MRFTIENVTKTSDRCCIPAAERPSCEEKGGGEKGLYSILTSRHREQILV